MMLPSTGVDDSEGVDSHYACIVYDQETGRIHHVHHVINLVGAQAPTEEEMRGRARANTLIDDGSDLAVVVVQGDRIERGKSYRVDHAAKALVVEQDRTTN
ncbi:MAG: hypothetical protein JWR37_1232 [Mycobacterium sp.]|nr:hypothetical protein [Mycobacterium sp.]